MHCSLLWLRKLAFVGKTCMWLWSFASLKTNLAPNELAAYFVLCDRSDGCWVGFTPREHAVGICDQMLDGVVVRLFEFFMPEHPNLYCHSLYHWNHGYALAEIFDDKDEIVDDEDEVGQNES